MYESASDEGRTSQEAGRLEGEEEVFSSVIGRFGEFQDDQANGPRGKSR